MSVFEIDRDALGGPFSRWVPVCRLVGHVPSPRGSRARCAICGFPEDLHAYPVEDFVTWEGKRGG